ncbi:MAG: hypothetical protein II784_05545 [Oscillospiraceae bacterium]|nr:hypothetical protein [Oscillospiraceae bacterium]
MTNKEAFWATVVEHKKTPFVPDYSCIAHVGGQKEWWENGPAGGGPDAFGVVWEGTVSTGGAGIPLPDPIVLTDITAWEDQVKFPDVDAIPWQELSEKWLAGIDRKEKFVAYCAYNAQYERVTHLMGFMEGLCAFSEEPEATAALLRAISDYKIASLERIAKYFKPDFYVPFDDVATQLSLFISPDTYRELVKPEHKRVNDACRSLGIYPLIHCCGKCESLIEDFIDEGFYAWCSAQPMNDIAAITKKYGDKIAVVGGYDSNGLPGMIEATDEDVEKEVFRCVNEYGKDGAFVFSGLRMGGSGVSREELVRPINAAYAKYRASLA